MHLLYANEWMTHAIMQAIGWTLVHSLWQGLIVSLLALCLLWSTKKSSPALRYNFLLLLLIIFLIAVLVTFSFYHKSRAIQQVREHVSLVNTSAPHFPKATVTHLMVEETKRHWTRFEHTFNMHANSIVAIWFLIFCIQGIRFGISLGYIYRIRHYKIYPPSTQWRARCNELKKILNIQKEVGLLESALVKVPVVIGYFKPLILIPIGLLSNLPYNQVESILLHELAHIKRRDYLINMLQSLVECLFFFNPALLWLSSLIKEEREACCDAQAVKQLGTKVQYIEALVSFQELSVRPSACALAFPGRRNFLLHRVQRILNNENTKLNSMEKTFLILGFSTIIAVSLIASKKVQAQKEILVPIIQSSSMLLDTVPKIKEQGNREVRQKGRTSTRVTTENDGHEKTVIVENKKEPGRVLSAKVINDTLREVSINGQAVPKTQMASYEVEIKSILTEQSSTEIIAQKTISQRKIPKATVRDQKPTQYLQQEAMKKSKVETVEPLNEEVNVTYKNSGTDDTHQQVDEIIAVLVKANIIKSKVGTTFMLTNNELLVNGVKQPGNIHNELKQKYIYKPADFINFYSDGKRTDIGTHRE